MKNLIIASSILASGALFAAQTKTVTFEKIDKNKDGFISKNESTALTELVKSFLTVDVDGDGKISAKEYRKYLAMDKAGTKGKTKN